MSKYFSNKETQCKCGCGLNIKEELLNKLNEARELAGIPFTITSGARCQSHNDTVGGSKTSSHVIGLAVDISAKTSSQKFVIVKALMEAGFTRIGIAKTFVHVDIDDSKSGGVIWTY